MAHSKNHRQNHNFQIANFLAGACFTPDGAYALLCDLREERQSACDNYKVQGLREEARKIRAYSLVGSADPAYQKEGQADLLEIENGSKAGKVLFAAAQAELKFIDECIARLQPLRKFKSLPDPEAHEAAQCDEWRLELIHRAENYLMSGGIPAGELATMRQHPEFATAILPRICGIQNLLSSPTGRDELTKQLSAPQSENQFKTLLLTA